MHSLSRLADIQLPATLSLDKVSVSEAKGRAGPSYNSAGRWRWGFEVLDRPFAKSTLQVFRAWLILHGKVPGPHSSPAYGWPVSLAT